MSHWADVVDAWVEDLTANVDGLADVKEHRYAPWSVENLGTVTNERHLAIWPHSEPDVVEGYAASPQMDLATERYSILVWEDASEDSSRRMDNEQANMDWLDLHEAIRDRLYELNNRSLGDPQIMDTRYQGVVFGVSGSQRVMELRFQVRVPRVYTG